MTRTRAIRTGPVAGLVAQIVLLAVLVGAAGLGSVAWTVGVACAVSLAVPVSGWRRPRG